MPLRPKIQDGKELISPAGIDILRLDDTKKKLGYYAFPFSCKLSFVPLINHWKKKVSSGDAGELVIAKEITRRLDYALEFLTPFENLDDIGEHRDFVELLLTGVFPSALRDQKLAFARKPCDPSCFYLTHPFLSLLTKDGLSFYINNQEGGRNKTILRACREILNEFYGQRIKFDEETILSMKIHNSPFEKHYKLELNTKFVEIKKLQPLKPISQEEINMLLSDITDIDLWLKYIPPSHFEFQGLVSVNLIDVTEQESISRLKKILLNKEAVIEPESIKELQSQLRTYFGMEKLVLGLMAVDFPSEGKLPLKYKINHPLLGKKAKRLFSDKNVGSIYEQAFTTGDTFIIEDVSKVDHPTSLEKQLLKNKIRSIVIVPLKKSDGEIIGMLELGSPKPYEFNGFVERKLVDVRPLFRTVMRRSRQEIDNEVEAIIREKYTALHPSVEWKFVDAAFKLIARRKKEGFKALIKPIIFKNVFPLYGQADIVGSTNIRNNSIQEDFLSNLSQINELLNLVENQSDFSIVENLRSRVEEEIDNLESGIVPDQEYLIAKFIQKEVHPFLRQVKHRNARLNQALEKYFSSLDKEMEIIYEKRKDYEESVERINRSIINYLLKEEKKNQEMLPHYYEQSKTDGIEYNIYIGQSLLKNQQFDLIHLQNLRLWQLKSMCTITRMMNELQNSLPIPLNTAQLILVYTNPLNIRFRMDEKQFDVDGIFDIRFPILKKRIDKALIEGTGERLTQSGKVAIVYSQDKDRLEYEKYIEYLLQKGMIKKHVERFSLGKMQGVQGLKALRITVNTDFNK